MATDIISVVKSFAQLDIDRAEIIADVADLDATKQEWRPKVHPRRSVLAFMPRQRVGTGVSPR